MDERPAAVTTLLAQPEPFRPSPNHSAYWVRMWQEGEQGPWRASAQSASTGEKLLFANLDELFAFLSAQTSSCS